MSPTPLTLLLGYGKPLAGHSRALDDFELRGTPLPAKLHKAITARIPEVEDELRRYKLALAAGPAKRSAKKGAATCPGLTQTPSVENAEIPRRRPVKSTGLPMKKH